MAFSEYMNFNFGVMYLVLPTNILSNILTKFSTNFLTIFLTIFVLSIYRFGIKIQKNRQCECHHRVATTAAAAAQWRRLRLRRRRQGPVQVQGNIVHFERPLTSELTFFWRAHTTRRRCRRIVSSQSPALL